LDGALFGLLRRSKAMRGGAAVDVPPAPAMNHDRGSAVLKKRRLVRYPRTSGRNRP